MKIINQFNKYYNTPNVIKLRAACSVINFLSKGVGYCPILSVLVGPARTLVNIACYFFAALILKATDRECISKNYSQAYKKSSLEHYKESCVDGITTGLQETFSIKAACYLITKIYCKVQFLFHIIGYSEEKGHCKIFTKIQQIYDSKSIKILRTALDTLSSIIDKIALAPIISTPIGIIRVIKNVLESPLEPLLQKCKDDYLYNDIHFKSFNERHATNIRTGLMEILGIKGLFAIENKIQQKIITSSLGEI